MEKFFTLVIIFFTTEVYSMNCSSIEKLNVEKNQIIISLKITPIIQNHTNITIRIFKTQKPNEQFPDESTKEFFTSSYFCRASEGIHNGKVDSEYICLNNKKEHLNLYSSSEEGELSAFLYLPKLEPKYYDLACSDPAF